MQSAVQVQMGRWAVADEYLVVLVGERPDAPKGEPGEATSRCPSCVFLGGRLSRHSPTLRWLWRDGGST